MTPPRDVLVPAGSATALVLGAASVIDDVLDGNGITGVDQPVLDWFVAHRDPVETAIATVVTNLGSTLAMAALTLTMTLWAASRRQWGHVAFLLSAAASGALVLGIKTMVGRVRPPQSVQLVTETSASFPSGHTLGSTAVILAVTGVLLTTVRSTAARAVTVAGGLTAVVLIGLSRLYPGAHWATDVLGGWMLGVAVVCALVTVAALERRRRGAQQLAVPGVRVLPGVPAQTGGRGR